MVVKKPPQLHAKAAARNAGAVLQIPIDPEDERLTYKGVVLDFNGKVQISAYADLMPRFAGEPPPDQHPDPTHPGVRVDEQIPNGLRIWDDVRAGATDKDGAGWIAHHKADGGDRKKEKWFNIRACGSWRLAFLLARLQRIYWDERAASLNASTAAPVTEVEHALKQATKEDSSKALKAATSKAPEADLGSRTLTKARKRLQGLTDESKKKEDTKQKQETHVELVKAAEGNNNSQVAAVLGVNKEALDHGREQLPAIQDKKAEAIHAMVSAALAKNVNGLAASIVNAKEVGASKKAINKARGELAALMEACNGSDPISPSPKKRSQEGMEYSVQKQPELKDSLKVTQAEERPHTVTPESMEVSGQKRPKLKEHEPNKSEHKPLVISADMLATSVRLQQIFAARR